MDLYDQLQSGPIPNGTDLETDSAHLGHLDKLAAFGSLDLVVLTINIPCRIVVANREKRRGARVRAADSALQVWLTICWVAKLGVGTGRSARGRVAPNRCGILPENLTKMAPALELAHVWVVVTPLVSVLVKLVIVETVGEDTRNVARSDAIGNILAISSATWCTCEG